MTELKSKITLNLKGLLNEVLMPPDQSPFSTQFPIVEIIHEEYHNPNDDYYDLELYRTRKTYNDIYPTDDGDYDGANVVGWIKAEDLAKLVLLLDDAVKGKIELVV